MLAVPWEAVEATIRSLGDLGGKLIADAPSPLDVGEGRVIALETPGSGGEFLQSLAPGAMVVKALNTVQVTNGSN